MSVGDVLGKEKTNNKIVLLRERKSSGEWKHVSNRMYLWRRISVSLDNKHASQLEANNIRERLIGMK